MKKGIVLIEDERKKIIKEMLGILGPIYFNELQSFFRKTLLDKKAI